MDLTVVIPVYNSSERLLGFGESLLRIFSSMPLRFEIIMVDDGSQDNSFQILQELHRNNSCVKVIGLKKNLGQHRAIFVGLQHASGRYILIMDDDMEYALEVLPVFWEKALEGCDVISGHRTSRTKADSGRGIIAKGINLAIASIAKQRFHDATSPFRLFKSDLINDLPPKGCSAPLLIPEYVMMIGKRIAEIPLPDDHREASKSRYTFLKLAEHTLMLLCTFFHIVIPSRTSGFGRSQCPKDMRNIKTAIGFGQ